MYGPCKGMSKIYRAALLPCLRGSVTKLNLVAGLTACILGSDWRHLGIPS